MHKIERASLKEKNVKFTVQEKETCRCKIYVMPIKSMPKSQ